MPHSKDIHSPALPSRSPFRIRDSQLAKIRQSKNERWSLSEELDTLWTIKAHNYAPVTQKEPAKTDLTDQLLTQLLISQAVIDSKGYEMLSIDNLERLKKNYIEVSDLVASLSRRITVENRIKNITHSLENTKLKNSRNSMMHFQRQRQNNETNLDQLSAQLSRLEMEKRKLKRTLLQHTATVLSKSIEELEQPTLGQDTQQLVQLESQIKQTTTRLNQLLVKHQYPKPAHSFNALVQQLDKQLSYYTSRIQSYKDKLEAKATYSSDPRAQQLMECTRQLHMLQLEVQTNESEKNDIYSKLLDIEAITNKAYTQISLHKNKEKGLKMELEQYKNEAMLLQRAKANREKPVTNNSKPDTYQVQLNQHMETFEKEIKHQQKLLDSSTRACQQLVAGCDELKKKRSELDDVARQKMQALSQKDSRITLLQQQSPSDDFSTDQTGKIDQNRIKQAQDEFKKEETKWTKDKGTIEKDFDQLLNEFDTLTGTAMDFDSHRMKYEKSIQQLTQDKSRLEGELLEERIKRIGYKGDGGPPNTSDLRKEFRQLIADLKSSHQQKMEQEAEGINKLRSQLQEIQDEKYSKKKRGVTTGIQT